MNTSKMEFRVKLEGVGPGSAWTYLRVPFDVEMAFGSKARVAVKGTINGFAYRSSIFPHGDGTHTLMVNKQMQQGAQASPGDTVKVVMEPDTASRRVSVPAHFKRALAKSASARAAFDKLAYSHQKAYLDAIAEAKKPETRTRRIEKALAMLAANKRAE